MKVLLLSLLSLSSFLSALRERETPWSGREREGELVREGALGRYLRFTFPLQFRYLNFGCLFAVWRHFKSWMVVCSLTQILPIPSLLPCSHFPLRTERTLRKVNLEWYFFPLLTTHFSGGSSIQRPFVRMAVAPLSYWTIRPGFKGKKVSLLTILEYLTLSSVGQLLGAFGEKYLYFSLSSFLRNKQRWWAIYLKWSSHITIFSIFFHFFNFIFHSPSTDYSSLIDLPRSLISNNPQYDAYRFFGTAGALSLSFSHTRTLSLTL